MVVSKRSAALVSVVLVLSILLPLPSWAATSSVTGRRIVLDPGHGGSDTGTTECPTLIEKEATLQIAFLLHDMLKADGATVTMTRTDDRDLSNSQRADIANTANGEALISVHLNGVTDHSINRTLGLWGKRHKDLEFTKVIHAKQLETLGLPDEGIRQFASRVLLSSNMPALISESLYLSNTEECAALTEGAKILLDSERPDTDARQYKIAQGLYLGLVAWFETH